MNIKPYSLTDLGLEVEGREEEEEALLLPALSSQFCAGGERKDT